MSRSPSAPRSASRRPELVALPGGGDPTPVDAFVAAMTAELGLGSSASAQRTRRLLGRLARWASAEGIPLDRERILDPDTVERFVTLALGGERSRATYRAELRRVGPLLTRKAPWEPRPVAIARRQLAPPYCDEEVGILLQDAFDQPSESRRRAAVAMVVFGVGAGLDGRWVTRVAGPDVTGHHGYVTVRVGQPSARTVVVIDAYEELALALADTAGDQYVVGGRSVSNRRTGQLVERLVTPTGHPRLAPARLRSTWLLWHLENQTRLLDLCAAAGLRGPGVLGDLFAYMKPLDQASAGWHLSEIVR